MTSRRQVNWRWIIAAVLIAALVFGLGAVLRTAGLGVAANVAQLVSLAPLLVSLAGWSRSRQSAAAASQGNRPVKLGSQSETVQQPRTGGLPSYAVEEFVGRREELAELLGALRDPGLPLITLTGIGGIGKTALAEEAVRRAAVEGLFTRTVWRSTQAEKFIGDGVERSEEARYSFDELLADILVQSGKSSIAGASTAVKLDAVSGLLATEHVLIVLDNLETVSNRDALVASLFNILGKGKLLITSRYEIKHPRVHPIVLKEGLSLEDGIAFLKVTASRRNIQALMDASRDTLTRIHSVTGGAPLAMLLVSGQMLYQPVEYTLRTIEKAGINKASYEFYSYIYKNSWSELDGPSRKVLLAMQNFESNPTAEGLLFTADMQEDDFYTAVADLIRRSLVNFIAGPSEAQYSLHPLTRYFINTDIAAGWT
jgi:hypothetical protein